MSSDIVGHHNYIATDIDYYLTSSSSSHSLTSDGEVDPGRLVGLDPHLPDALEEGHPKPRVTTRHLNLRVLHQTCVRKSITLSFRKNPEKIDAKMGTNHGDERL